MYTSKLIYIFITIDEKGTIPLADTYEQCLLYVRNSLKKILKKNPITLEVMWENWYLDQEKKYGNVKYGNDQNMVRSEIEKKNIILDDIIDNVEKGIFIEKKGHTPVLSGVNNLNKNSENYSDNHDRNDGNDHNENDDDTNDNRSNYNNHHNNDNNDNHDHDDNHNNDSYINGLDSDINVSIDHDNDSDHMNDNGNHINYYNYHNNDVNHSNNHNNDSNYEVYDNMNSNNNCYDEINLSSHDDSIINDVRSRTRSTSIGNWNQVFEQIESIGDDDELADNFVINPMGLSNKPKVSKNGVLDNLEDDDFFFSNPMKSPVSCIYIYKYLIEYA